MSSPIRIGILNDLANGPPNPSDIEQWLRMAAEETAAAGRIPRDIEFVNAWGLGLPSGTADAVERAYETLVHENVLMIVGPAIGDNALIATPLAERYRVPTINWAGIARAPELTREGIKSGLEKVKWLPAAQGYDGTLLGFGHFDRGALHGRYLVLRQWQNQRSIEVTGFPDAQLR